MTSVQLYNYSLPPERIAQEPAPCRDASRALFLKRGREALEEDTFSTLPGRLSGDECLIVNDTRVIPARIRAHRPSGGLVEVFLLRPEEPGLWRAWLSPARRVQEGEALEARGERLTVRERRGSFWLVELDPEAPERLGEVPLPPYIHRNESDPRLQELDRERYQTIFARQKGAVAAPTAGLHFTDKLLAELDARSIPVVPVTLHVGPGTFQPIRSQEVEEHRVEPELYEITSQARQQLARALQEGRRLVCVGTTCLRLLESLEVLEEGPNLLGETNLTIGPGHQFRHVQGLITNFHLPCSSLLVLVATFHGRDHTLAAYHAAMARGFRFYSYGDVMVILPGEKPC